MLHSRLNLVWFKKEIPFLTFFFIFLFCFFLIRSNGPQWVSHLYTQGHLKTLNTIILVNARLQLQSYFEKAVTFARAPATIFPNRQNEPSWDPWDSSRILNQKQSLDYYQGQIENVLLGPIKSLIVGILLISFCFRYLSKASMFQFGLTIFVYFLITRPEVLLNPPFGEGITGPFSDAVWLYQHSLNYFELLKQDTVMTGGPQIYPTALFPLGLAVLMKLSPSPIFFLILMHLLIFSMSAAVVAMVRFFALKTMSEKLATLTAILVVALPLFQCMLEVINLEMPVTFFTMMCAYSLYKTRKDEGLSRLTRESAHTASTNFSQTRKPLSPCYLIPCLWALAALFTKEPGVMACLAVFIIATLDFFKNPSRRNFLRIYFFPTLMMLIATVKILIRNHLLGEQQDFYRSGLGLGWHNLNYLIWFYLFVVCLIFIGFKTILTLRQIKTHAQWQFKVQKLFDQHYAAGIMFLMTILWCLVFNNFLTLAYRYELLLMPFVIFSLSYSLYLMFQKNERLTARFLMGFCIFGFIASYGLVFFDKNESFPTNLERSLEYRNYLKLEQALAKELDQNYANRPIIAPFQTAQAIAIPELGYVKNKLDVTVYGMRATLGIKSYPGIKNIDLMNTVWVGFPHQHLVNVPYPYPIDPTDYILKKLQVGHLEVMIFNGGLAIERVYRVVLYQEQKNMIKK